MTKTKLQIEDNQYTYLYKWDVKDPIAVMHLIHGSKEHIGRYEGLIKYLNKQNISVYGIDLRGHGESSVEQNRFGHIDSYKRIVNDFDKVNEQIKTERPGVKIVMFGHSMGSFVLRYYLSFNKECDAIICGTNEQDPLSIYSGLIVAKLTKLVKGKQKINKLVDSHSYKSFDKQMKPGESWLSNDPKIVSDYEVDPLNPKAFTNESFIAMLSWLKEIRKKRSYTNHKGKLLIISGGNDPVGNKGEGPKKVFNKYFKQGANVKIKLYDGGHHEIHNDKNKKEVYKDISDFIKGA